MRAVRPLGCLALVLGATTVPVAASAAPEPARSLAGTTVVLNPGHNGGNAANPRAIDRQVDAGNRRKACDTTGTATAGGYAEHAYAWDVALRTRRLLREAGARVVLTRDSDRGVGPCIDRRAAIGNRGDAVLSIHADGAPAGVRGFHVIRPARVKGLTDDIYTSSRRLAADVRATWADGTGVPPASYAGRDGIDERSDLGGLNLSDVPSVFIESGNMRNARDAALLGSPAFRQRAARALARGLTRFLQR